MIGKGEKRPHPPTDSSESDSLGGHDQSSSSDEGLYFFLESKDTDIYPSMLRFRPYVIYPFFAEEIPRWKTCTLL